MLELLFVCARILHQDLATGCSVRAVAEISDLRAEIREAHELQTQAARDQNAEILDRLDSIQRHRDVSVWDGFAQVTQHCDVCPPMMIMMYCGLLCQVHGSLGTHLDASDHNGHDAERELTRLHEQCMSTINPSVPIEQACPLVAEKLLEPDRVLDEEASIDLIRTGIAYGLVSAQAARGRDIVIVIGNTGAGKSTTVNFLAGCTMELRNVKGQLGDVVVVRPVSEGGATS